MDRNITALFMEQSLRDSENDFRRALNSENAPHFNVIALTASNEHQAEGFRRQLASRELPPFTEFVVIPDRNGERIGSGGATLSVIKYVREKYGSFKNLTVCCIHSGGDSKRTPTYSALGKLFSPVPRTLSDGRPSTLFDEFMISVASIPGRIREGMLLLSGDVLLMFNPLQIDWSGSGAAVISFKECAETGKDHGVFLKGPGDNVKKFLHKQSVETLTELGAVNEAGKVSIDTGAILFGTDVLEGLYGLVKDKAGEEKYISPVTRLSLYGDFLYPLAEDSSLEAFYEEKPEGEFCPALKAAREELWRVLRPYRMKLLSLAPARFIHFGTTGEVLNLMNGGYKEYEALGWTGKICSSLTSDTAAYNSVVRNGAEIGERTYLESSYIHHDAKIGKNCVISFADIHDEVIPDNVVVHVLKQRNGRFVCRIYGVEDNPKQGFLFGKKLSEFGDYDTLWGAELYPECATVKEAVAASLNLYELVVSGSGDREAWEKAEKRSLRSGFNSADTQAIILWNRRMRDYVRMDELAAYCRSGRPASEVARFPGRELTTVQEQWLDTELARADCSRPEDFSYVIRLYYYLGIALDNEKYIEKCFDCISETILANAFRNLKLNETARIVSDETVVRLPLRVNWGGGWSDTPPHCMEQGGVVLNAAVSLGGELPVTVKLRKLDERKVVFDSRDMNVHGEYTELEPLQMTGDPYDPFALQKACLIACGIIPSSRKLSSSAEGRWKNENGEWFFSDDGKQEKTENEEGSDSLESILGRLGGGFEMSTEVSSVPKGSGLGTSSILAAAAVKAVFEFMGIEHAEDDLYSTVLAMEQIMSTGGGWQDQVGGVTDGIKLISSKPGIDQQIRVEHIQLSEETKKELNERFCLIYTGQRRLARNLLRDVVGRYVGNEPDSLYAHKEIQKSAALMRFALERDNVDEFAALLDQHWLLSQKVDAGSTNTLLDQILMSIDNLIAGRMVCGAGGGGFLQVVLNRGVSKAEVHRRLKSVFQDFAVDVWESEIVF